MISTTPLSNLLFLSLSLLALLPPSIATPAPATPTVTATAGKIIGRSSLVDPSVHAYLGIPFAESPTGSRRFSPPVRLPKQNSPISAKEFSVACINQPLDALGESPLGFDVPEGEDCLTVNIWTKPGRNNAPVLIFFYGGGFLFGGSSWGLYEGTYFAAHNDAVVVSFNYRLNVFGFPNSPGVKTENLGILDQRMALEWIRDNIRAFGGDPSKMTMFGHSAGAASVDLHTFAWPKDPIVKGLIPQSGSVGLLPLLSGGDRYDRWGNLTEKVGCADAGSHKNVLECMRKISSEKIVEGMRGLEACGNQLLPPFGPRVDGKIIFSPEEYQRRGEKGLFAKLPMLIGSTDNEVPAGTNIIPGCAPEAPHGVLTAEQEAKISTAVTFTCPAKESAGYRLHHKLPIWRYRYYGNFTLNSTVVPDFGASHGSELSVIFGTAHQFGNLPDKEKAIVKYLQSAWTAFAKSPSSGLSSDPFNLPLYKERTLNLEEPTLLRLAYGDEAAPSLTWPEEEDWICALVANGGVDKEKRDGGLGLNRLRGGSWRL